MSRGTKATIHLDAIRHNLQVAKQQALAAKTWSVIKANGYGHGAEQVALALADLSDGFAVATLDEAKSLYDVGIRNPILLLEGVVAPDQLPTCAAFDFHVMLHSVEHFDWLTQVSLASPITVWIKVDTGMHRLGMTPDQALAVAEKLSRHPEIRFAGFMSHFACADTPEHPLNQMQLDSFAPFVSWTSDSTPVATSCANSAAIFAFPASHGQWLRPGIMLYGSTPFADQSAAELGLQPAMTLSARVIALRQIQPGENVGYCARWQAQRPSTIATVAIGYGDGYPRAAPDGTPVWINQQRATLVGTVSMDMITIDVTDVSSVQVGDCVELWGNHVAVDEVASACGTIGYELLTRLTSRLRLEYTEI